MSITDELRKWAKEHLSRNSILAIADRIDAAALSRRNAAYIMGYKAGIDMGFASADDWLADHEDEMAEHGWIRLPKDADGVPIRVGDVIKLPNGRSEEVRYMIINGAGWLINEAGWISCKVSHDKPDTWERIIEDAMGRYSDADADALVARCKALAGEGE